MGTGDLVVVGGMGECGLEKVVGMRCVLEFGDWVTEGEFWSMGIGEMYNISSFGFFIHFGNFFRISSTKCFKKKTG